MDLVLIKSMADGEWHSGEALASFLGVSRTAVWKRIKALSTLGLSVEAQKGLGYRLTKPLDLLDMQVMLQGRAELDSSNGVSWHLGGDVGSTNDWAFELLQSARAADEVVVCLAECQRSGRGRRGRSWVSPFGDNLYLSLAYREPGGVAAVDGLSLVVGISVARALERLGASGIKLKWPNDVFWGDRKLGGILVELRGELATDCHVVIGVGVNVHMSESAEIDQPWVSLAECMGQAPSRSRLAGLIVGELLQVLRRYKLLGVQACLSDWSTRDLLAGRVVRVEGVGLVGVGLGIAEDGAYRVQVGDEERRIRAGELSVRLGDGSV